jgi:hypothetical protein
MIRSARSVLAAAVVGLIGVVAPATALAGPALAVPHVGLWTPLLNASTPGERADALAYGAQSHQLLMIPGVCSAPHICPDPVELSADDGQTWTQIRASVTSQVEPFSAAAVETLVAAPALGGVVRICCDLPSPPYVATIEAWNGSSWTALGSAGYPGFCGAYGYDAAHALIVNFCQGRTYTYDGTGWTLQHPAHAPADASLSAQMAFDPATGSVLLVTGSAAVPQLESTWLWNGSDWRLADSGSFALDCQDSPFDPQFDSLATDTKDGAVLLTACGEATTGNPESWAWNGQAWTLQALPPAGGPPFGGLLAYDTALGAVITDNDTQNDWWRWTGLT